MVKNNIKQYLVLLNKYLLDYFVLANLYLALLILLTIQNAYPYNNKQCMNQPNHINLHPNEYIEGLCYYQFAISLDRCMGSCNTLNDLSNKVYDPNKK